MVWLDRAEASRTQVENMLSDVRGVKKVELLR